MIEANQSASPLNLYRAEQVRAMDRFIIDRLGIPGAELMRRAGSAAFAVMREVWPEARTVSVLCGSGNNGGDGYILARLALETGMDVRVYPLASMNQLQGDALGACRAYRDAGGPALDFAPADFEGAEVLVDGLLGTGLDREVGERYAEAIRAIDRFRGGVLALDIPSGLDADTGRPRGCAVKADATVSFVGLKQGLFTGEGLAHCGRIFFHDLDAPRETLRLETPAAALAPIWRQGLPPRSRAAHKGNFGHALIIGGELGYSGAARLAAEAAARVGAGLISIATRPEHAGLMNIARPELMCRGVTDARDLEPLFGRANVVAVGPGLGQGAWSKAMFAAALACGLPLVADADALNLMAHTPLRRDDWVLTPHPGEAARLLQTTAAAVQADRFAAVQALRKRYGGTVVLKGSGTLVLGASGRPWVCIQGNPGMAGGGMGDVLTGAIAGLIAQGMPPEEAALTGVRLHGAAGDKAAEEGGERGLLAGDLAPWLRRLVNL